MGRGCDASPLTYSADIPALPWPYRDIGYRRFTSLTPVVMGSPMAASRNAVPAAAQRQRDKRQSADLHACPGKWVWLATRPRPIQSERRYRRPAISPQGPEEQKCPVYGTPRRASSGGEPTSASGPSSCATSQIALCPIELPFGLACPV